MRKTNLSRLFARRVDGIFLSDFEQGEIGPDLFRHACLLGLEGLVSKHKDRPYRAGRSPHWVKMKNPKHPAMTRVQDAHRGRTLEGDISMNGVAGFQGKLRTITFVVRRATAGST
jgi:ATP-dependent DNA ligase